MTTCEKKYHFYLLFVTEHRQGVTFQQEIYLQLSRPKVTKQDINEAKKAALNVNNGVVNSISYLGHMTETEFSNDEEEQEK